MPCGGIEPYPATTDTGTIKEELSPTKGGCWVCQRGGAKHFCHEWDTYIHARCALAFLLNDDEGQCVIAHKHIVELDFSIEETL